MVSNLHWKYFLALDDDFGELARFIEPSEQNMGAYSLEMARILMAASQECDVTLRELCAMSGDTESRNEQGYRSHLVTKFPCLSSIEVSCPRYDLSFTPFSNWLEGKTPYWWTANNKVKHQRSSHYSDASLINVMNAISALLVVNLYLHKDNESKLWLSPEPRFFKPNLESRSKRTVMHSQYIVPD